MIISFTFMTFTLDSRVILQKTEVNAVFFSAVRTQYEDLSAIKVNCFQIFDEKLD